MSGDSAGADPGQSAPAQPVPAQQGSGHDGTRHEDAGRRDAGPGGDAGQGNTAQGDAGQAGAETVEAVHNRAWQAGGGEPGRAGWDVPWAESPAAGAGTPAREELEVAFATAMRRTGALMQLTGQAAADRIGINATDLNCLNILSFSGRMTAGELARATGLTTASITGVIDRLEEAGFVSRERDPHDRRRVVVTIALDRAVRDVASVFLPLMRDWREMSARYSDDELRLIVDFYSRMEQVFRAHLIRLRDG